MHLVQHIIAPLKSTIVIGERIIVFRSFGKSGQKGCFFNGQFIQRFSKIIKRSSGDPIRVKAQIDVVEIKLHDLVFAKRRFHALHHECLTQFADHSAVITYQKVFGNLLGYGGRTDHLAAVGDFNLHIAHCGFGKAMPIDA